MPRYLALEWDSREARIAIAVDRGGEVELEHALTVDLGPRDVSGSGADDLGRRLSEALAGRISGKVETLVAVGRASIELKVLSLPPAPDEELPDLVRFQALREFHSLEADWPLDFLPLGSDADGPRSVLAAAISPELVEQIEQTCQAASLKAQRLVLRPCAAASLLKRQPAAGSERVRLLVDLLVDEADLSVMVEQDVVFTRTVRLPGSASHSEQWAALLGEMRRTMAAAHNQLGGQRVAAVYLLGDRDDQAELAGNIEAKLSLPTRLINPFAGIRLGRRLARNLPEHRGRFAPLLGMLLDEAAETQHAIDFLNPRRPAAPKSRRRLYVTAAAVAAVVLVAVFGGIWAALASLDRQAQALGAQISQLDGQVKAQVPIIAQVAEIDKWAVSDVVWLDELYRLADQLPPAQDTMLLGLQCLPSAEGGRMELDGLVRSSELIEHIESSLRDEAHSVAGRGSHQNEGTSQYRWRFKTSVDILTQAAPGSQP